MVTERTRCFCSSLKTLLMRAEGSPSLSCYALIPPNLMAGFQTSPNGRFWVSPEECSL